MNKRKPSRHPQGSNDSLGKTLGILSAFAMLADLDRAADPIKAQASRERMLFATPGIIKPDDWDSLPFEERRRRTDLALEQIKP